MTKRPWYKFTIIEVLVVVGIVALLIWILLPERCASSERANRIKCQSNLLQIYKLMESYAKRHGGEFPASLEAILRDESSSFELVVCPSSADEKAVGATREEALANFRKGEHNCSYVYLGAGKRLGGPADAVLVYEKPVNHELEGSNILYGDGRVEWCDRASAAKLLPGVSFERTPAATRAP